VSFLAELRRRRVVRVAVVYAATGFVMLQAADLILPRLGVPEWAMSLIVVLLLLGFPVALVLGWALELTPDGVRVTQPMSPEPRAPGEPLPSLLGRRTVLVAGALALLGTGLGAGIVLTPESRGREAVIADRSIAVVPFADFSPDADQQWFSDGLAEEILNALARLQDVRVAPRSGSFRFRGHDGDVRMIADSLGVAHILQGSVRRAGERVRITAQLVRASDNVHLWSQSFDRDAADIIGVQEEVAYEIARTLQTALDPQELARMVAAGTNSVAAYEAFLRYWHYVHRAAELEHWSLLTRANELLELARAADPQFWRAHDEAANFWMAQLNPMSRLYGISELGYAARHAITMERVRAAEATAPDALSRLRTERMRANLELRLRDVLQYSQRIVELDPSGEEWLQLGSAARAIGQYDIAREAYRRAAEHTNDLRLGIVGLAAQYHRVDPDAALTLIAPMLAGDMNNLDQLYQAHRILLAAGRVQQAAELAERYLARSTAPTGRVVVRLRQLCAEGRGTEAAAYIDSLPAHVIDTSVRWHAAHYLGRHDEMVAALRALDDAGELFSLSMFLTYTFFDPRPFPKLSAALRRNGALRTEPLPIPYACPVEEQVVSMHAAGRSP
jgi:TolB-like protein